MGTRWRGLLAPINKPTGDGRRIASGAFTHRPLPLPLKWQREDDVGHDASVIIGTLETVTIDDKAGEVWGEGELFDDQPDLVRLTEDVKEAILLTTKKIIGPSVDAGAAEVVFVREGSDTPLTDEEWERLIWEEIDTGISAPIEMLFTLYEIAAATLVAIPAFAEARAFELIDMTADTSAEAGSKEPAKPAAAAARRQLALTAAAGPVLPPAAVFDPPSEAPAYQLVTVHPRRAGENFQRVSGYAFAFGVCHVGIRDGCYTAPPTTTDYALFNRFPFETDAGLVGVGRITTGHGRVGTQCGHLKCRGKDDHACDDATLSEAIAHYDRLRTVAHVRAVEFDGVGLWVQGILAVDADDRDLAVLSRQRVSGDWRPAGVELELVEVLALAREMEGFPIPHVGMLNGRKVSLTAAGAVPPRSVALGRRGMELTDAAKRIGDAVADSLIARGVVFTQPAALTAAADDAPVHTGAMVALRMADDDAARLAVDGGEPADELHLTLAYLGDADQLDDTTRASIVDALTALVGEWKEAAGGHLTVVGDGSAVTVFNAADDEEDTAIVLGFGGDDLAAMHTQVVDAVTGVFEGLPAQHAPWVAHVTLLYSDDLTAVEDVATRTGEVQFDRLRVAFGGTVHDIPLSAAVSSGASDEEEETAASLLAELDAAYEAVAADTRAREAAALLDQIEGVTAGVR